MYGVNVTKHGSERMRKRMGIPKKSVDRIAAKAFYFGCKESKTYAPLYEVIDQYDEYDKSKNYSVVYGNYIFIFDRNTLITVYLAPAYKRWAS